MDGPSIDKVARKTWDPLELPEGPITRGKMKKFKEALHGLVMNHQGAPTSLMSRLEELGKQMDQEELLKNVIKVQEALECSDQPDPRSTARMNAQQTCARQRAPMHAQDLQEQGCARPDAQQHMPPHRFF